MKMLASIKTHVPEGRAAKSLGEDRELIAFGDLLNHLRGEALQQSLGLLDGAVAHDLQQDSFLVLQWQRRQGPQLPIFVDRMNRECFHDLSFSLPLVKTFDEPSPILSFLFLYHRCETRGKGWSKSDSSSRFEIRKQERMEKSLSQVGFRLLL